MFSCVLLCVNAPDISHKLFPLIFPYDGGASGSFEYDSTLPLRGYFDISILTSGAGIMSPDGKLLKSVNGAINIGSLAFAGSMQGARIALDTDGLPDYRTGNIVKPASISAWAYIVL